MNWNKIEITTDNGEIVNAQTPVIVSASRSTDIPAFYADWFIERWKRGYVKWKNPFNGEHLYVSFRDTLVVVFWSKNPYPMLKHIDFLNENVRNYYFQFSLNDYEKEGYEGNVPRLDKRIDTFKKLSDRIGPEKVIWRFDPMLLTENIDTNEILQRVKYIGDQLKGYTKKLVYSYADIHIYKKVEANLKKENIPYREFTNNDMHAIAAGLQEMNHDWKYEIGTCSEKISLEEYGIVHNKCIDDDLMIKLFSHEAKLMEFLGVEIVQPDLFSEHPEVFKHKKLKDKGQRELCGCIFSKDIGQYNSCPHECVYCYANTSKEIAKKNFKLYRENPGTDMIF